MANEYKCDICGATATVHITKIVGGKKIKVHLCENCAKKASFDSLNLPADLFPKIKKLEETIINSVEHAADGKFCKMCGADLGQIVKGERFSCPSCYMYMGSERLFELFSQLHAATRHCGKTPKTHADCQIEKLPEFSLGGTVSDLLSDIVSAETSGGEQSVADSGAPKLEEISAETPYAEKTDEDAEIPIQKRPATESDSRETLMRKLNSAIADERYEDAAKIRDLLKIISAKS